MPSFFVLSSPELARDLRPDSQWAAAVEEWWESVGGPADRSAALRDMMRVTIPGEPRVETPQQSKLFADAQRRMIERVVSGLSQPDRPTGAKAGGRSGEPKGGRKRSQSRRGEADGSNRDARYGLVPSSPVHQRRADEFLMSGEGVAIEQREVRQ